MQRKDLEDKADAIELAASAHELPLQVTGGNVTARYIQFRAASTTLPAPALYRQLEALSREIAGALGAAHVRVTRLGDSVRIDVPRDDPQPLSLLQLLRRIPPARIPFGATVLGLADDGAPLLVRLPAPEVGNIVLYGSTGSGKTTLLRTMALSLALYQPRHQVQLVVIDLDKQLADLDGLPHLFRPRVTGPDQAETMLTGLRDLLNRRIATQTHAPLLIVLIDGLHRVFYHGAQAQRERIQNALTALIKDGHTDDTAGIHVIAAVEKEILLPLAFQVRLLGHLDSAEQAYRISGVKNSGAERLTGSGDFIVLYGPGAIRFQAAYLTPEETRGIVQRLGQNERGVDIIQRPASTRQPTTFVDARSDAKTR